MPKDGEERKIETELVFTFVEPDYSVGINGGWCLAGMYVGKTFLEITGTDSFKFDEAATNHLKKMEAEIESEEDWDEDEGELAP